MIERVRYRVALSYGPEDLAPTEWAKEASFFQPTAPIIDAFRATLEGIDPELVENEYVFFQFHDRAGVVWHPPIRCEVSGLWPAPIPVGEREVERPARYAVIHRALKMAQKHINDQNKTVPELGFILVDFTVGELVVIQREPGATRFERELELEIR